MQEREPWFRVSGGSPYLFPALRALGPVGHITFGGVICASLFVMFFGIVNIFVDRFRPLFWLHVGVIFHVCCITFRASIHMDMSSILQGFSCIVCNNCIDLNGPTSNWWNIQQHLYLRYFCGIYLFAKTCCLIISETCCAVVFGTEFDYILDQCWHHAGILFTLKLKFFDNEILIISWCVFDTFLQP